MVETLVSMIFPLCVLLAFGVLTLGMAWWATIAAEGKDEWLTGDEE